MNPAPPVPLPRALIDLVLEFLSLATGATDASLWLPDPNGGHLVMQACPSQPVLAGQVRQDLASGLVSASYQTGTVIDDTGMFADKRRSDTVDAGHAQRTIAQIAAPLIIAGSSAGVVSIAIIIRGGKSPGHWGFKPDSKSLTVRAAAILAIHLASGKAED